ncbi:MAG: NAD-dependent epimerase/dehydratase family protein [Planctomycetota bacterium]
MGQALSVAILSSTFRARPRYVEFNEGSVTDRASVKQAVKDVDYIFHLAAMISVPESMDKPIECVEINTQGTLNVLQEAAAAGVQKLCFSSSAANYGDNPTVPKLETMIPEPKSPYAVTKLDGEYYCKMFSDEGWLQTACMRYFNVFGPRQDPGSAYAAAIPIFIHKAIRNEANVYLAENADLTGVFNVAYGKRQTINDIARKTTDD